VSRDQARIVALHHIQIAIPPGQEETARDFYGELLGLQELPKPQALVQRGGCWFGAAGLEIHLGVEADFRPARKAHPALLVNGLDTLRARLEVAGAEVTDDAPLPGYRRFHVHDPFGNRLELLEEQGAT